MNETPLLEFNCICGYLIKDEVSPQHLIDRAKQQYDLEIDPKSIRTGYYRWGIDPEGENNCVLYSTKKGKGAFLATVGYKVF